MAGLTVKQDLCLESKDQLSYACNVLSGYTARCCSEDSYQKSEKIVLAGNSGGAVEQEEVV